jgi:hypothetical protein
MRYDDSDSTPRIELSAKQPITIISDGYILSPANTKPISTAAPSSGSPLHSCSHLLRVVDVVDQVLDDGRGVGCLGSLAVVGDHGAGGSADDDGAGLALGCVSLFGSVRFVFLRRGDG